LSFASIPTAIISIIGYFDFVWHASNAINLCIFQQALIVVDSAKAVASNRLVSSLYNKWLRDPLSVLAICCRYAGN
jgi:hypothetical protein